MSKRRRPLLVVSLVLAAVCLLVGLLSGSIAIVLIALPALALTVLFYYALIRGRGYAGVSSEGGEPYLSTVFGGARDTAADAEALHGETVAAQIAHDERPAPKPPGRADSGSD